MTPGAVEPAGFSQGGASFHTAAGNIHVSSLQGSDKATVRVKVQLCDTVQEAIKRSEMCQSHMQSMIKLMLKLSVRCSLIC